MSLKKNFRMFQAGEVYDLESSKKDVTKISALGVEPDVSVFQDDNEIDPEIEEQDIQSQYSRAMRFFRGNGIVDNTDTDYTCNINDILYISMYIKWKIPETAHPWLQNPIFLYFRRGDEDPLIINLQVPTESGDMEQMFKATSNFQYIELTISNTENNANLTLTIYTVDNGILTNGKTLTNPITAKTFNLANDSFIYIGVNPAGDTSKLISTGIVPIVDDIKISINEPIERSTSQYTTTRNVTPLWINYNIKWGQPDNFLRVY